MDTPRAVCVIPLRCHRRFLMKNSVKTRRKVLPSSIGLNAVRAYQTICCNAVPTLMDYHFDEGNLILSLCHIEGRHLGEWAASPTCLEHLPAVLANSFRALMSLHHFGFLHRDIKPENLIVDSASYVFFIDLDQALPVEEAKCTTEVVGSLQYMAPETLYQPEDIDFSSDYYALARAFLHVLEPHMAWVQPSILKALEEMCTYVVAQRPQNIERWLNKMLK